MTFGETEEEKAVETTLKEAGFTVSQRCCSRSSCFDFAARKNPHIIFVKVQPETTKVPPNDYLELKIISTHVSATSLLVSEKSYGTPLEDDTLYSRHNIPVVTQETFENIVLHKNLPLIQAGLEGYYVKIDGEAIKQRREELGFSLSSLAELVGIPRRTLHDYERGVGKASVSTAYNLIRVLGIPVAKPVDVFTPFDERPKNNVLTVVRQALSENKILKRIFQKLTGFNITAVRRAPFDFLIDIQKRTKIIGGVVNGKEREINPRVEEILSVSRVIQAYPLLVTKGCELLNGDLLCIPSGELSEVEGLEDLILTFK